MEFVNGEDVREGEVKLEGRTSGDERRRDVELVSETVVETSGWRSESMVRGLIVRDSEVFTAVAEVDEGGIGSRAEEEGAEEDEAEEDGTIGAEERVDEGKEIEAPDVEVGTEVVEGGPSVEG